MTKYVSKTMRPKAWVSDDYEWFSGNVEGREVIDTGDWSEDRPIGLLDANGNMIYRLANRIGYLARD